MQVDGITRVLPSDVITPFVFSETDYLNSSSPVVPNFSSLTSNHEQRSPCIPAASISTDQLGVSANVAEQHTSLHGTHRHVSSRFCSPDGVSSVHGGRYRSRSPVSKVGDASGTGRNFGPSLRHVLHGTDTSLAGPRYAKGQSPQRDYVEFVLP